MCQWCCRGGKRKGCEAPLDSVAVQHATCQVKTRRWEDTRSWDDIKQWVHHSNASARQQVGPVGGNRRGSGDEETISGWTNCASKQNAEEQLEYWQKHSRKEKVRDEGSSTLCSEQRWRNKCWDWLSQVKTDHESLKQQRSWVTETGMWQCYGTKLPEEWFMC